jgi:hypothetical protein
VKQEKVVEMDIYDGVLKAMQAKAQKKLFASFPLQAKNEF